MPGMTGLEYLRTMLRGELPPPPITSLMRMSLTAVDAGTATFVCEPDESHYNPIGTVHGGLVCTLLDSALGCAVQTTLPQGFGYTSIGITVNYLRPVHSHSGPLTCVATVTKPGRRVAFADGVVTDSAGKTVATATGSLLVFPIGEGGEAA
ncbi:PaaI family thioesterase [Leifsonia sp. AG29]|uniref:PaaI family thioesterase n=1 Tax=Leifsonia sp. AG29 TaxID=2598860 RepID=UPI00131D4094